MLFYPAALPLLSSQTLSYVAGVIGRHRKEDRAGLAQAQPGQAGLAGNRIWGIFREPAAAGLITLADKGYHGAGQRSHGPLSCWHLPGPVRVAQAQVRADSERAIVMYQ